ncbi:MAG: hypothetical protein MUF50_04905 [Planctomycetes bacterium]|jgi:hypothetical protein|nr:hypothetical protein [Planctomycetota bacterium]
MVLPVAEALTTPCLTTTINPIARQKLKEQYRVAKHYGIKAAWGVVTGSGVLELAKEVAKGEIVKQGKQKVGALILLGCSHVGLGAVTLVTNSTKILKYAKKAHSVTSCIYRCAHDASEVPLIVLDFVLFGEYVPSCPANGYQLFNVSSDALDQIANLNE